MKDKKGLLKRLKNIEDKTDNVNINVINDGSKLKKIDFYNPQSERSRKAAQEINEIIMKLKKFKMLQRIKLLKNIHQNLILFVRIKMKMILTNI